MKTLYIDVGGCEVLKNGDHNIKIVLGSCIGIVIYHRESRIIGAIHILLPRYKPSAKEDRRITAFADKGIHHLISTMRSYTHKVENYKAILAGGADLAGSDYFNIGKENYRACKQILKDYGIEIIYEDCLGDKPRILDFYTKDFSFEIQPVSRYSYPQNIKMEYNPIEIINEVKNSSSYFPVPNRTIVEILRLPKDKLDPDHLEEILLKDDFVSANFLRFANSSYCSPKNKITNLRQAIVYVGIENMYKFINNLLIQDMVKKHIYSYSIDIQQYKIHILSVALLSEIIADLVDIPNHLAYLGGLFHDLGKVILDLYALEKFSSTKRYAIISFVEDAIKSTAHAVVGRFYLQSLNLDEVLLNIVEYHHYPHHAPTDKKCVATVALANVLITNFMIGTDNIVRSTPFSSPTQIYELLNIELEQMETIISNIPYLISVAEELVI